MRNEVNAGLAYVDELRSQGVSQTLLYMEEATVGINLLGAIIKKCGLSLKLRDSKKDLKASAKRLQKNEKLINTDVDGIGIEAAPKHLYQVINAVQQAQHLYTISTKGKDDVEVFSAVADYLRGVPNAWELHDVIEKARERKRKLTEKDFF